MKFKYVILPLLVLSNITMANPNPSTLQVERAEVIDQYLDDLQKADYKHIAQLFEPNGIVVSTSRGKANAKEFFYAFLPNVVAANTEKHPFICSRIYIL